MARAAERRVSTREPASAFPALQRTDLAEGRVVIVQCWAAWDAPLDAKCAAHLAQAARMCQVEHLCRSHDSGDPAWFEDMRLWGVLNIPAVVLLRHGVRVDTIVGVRPVDELEAVLSRWAEIV
jgi:hypothetical protein